MGMVMQRMIQLGEYCDCLENWRKYTENHEETSSNLQISQNLSNIELQLQMTFEPQRVENGLDEQLKIMHERLDRKKRMKAEYIKRRQRQRLAKQIQMQRIKQEKMKKLKIQKQRLIHKQQQLGRRRQQQVQKMRRQNQERKIRANKRNHRHRERQRQNSALDELSTTDENIVQLNSTNPFDEEKFQEYDFQEEEIRVQLKQQNIQQQQEQLEKTSEKIDNQTSLGKDVVLDQDVNQIASQQLDSYLDTLATAAHQAKTKDNGLQIIDLSKLDPASIQDQISELVLRKLNLNQRLTSQTVPLHPKETRSHRVVGNQMTQILTKKGHLRYEDREECRFEEDEIQFGGSQLTRQNTENYFLDDKDKLEYMRSNKYSLKLN